MNGGFENRVLVLDASYDAGVLSDAIERILQKFPMELQGKSVLVKPNMLAGEPPEKGVTTHPLLVEALVRKLKQLGASVMVGDNPGVFGYGKSEHAAKISGIRDAAGDCFVNLSRNAVAQKLRTRDVDHVMIAGDVLSADLVINLPKLKTHALTYYTGAVKNTFGYVVGGYKMRTHSLAPTPKRFAEALVDIYSIRPPDLNIMDAVTAMEGNGPHHGRLRNLGKILASPNGVCLDAAALHMIGRRPESVPHIKIAAQRGLGIIDIAKIDIDGEITPISDFKMPSTFTTGLVGAVLNRFLSGQMSCLPVVVEEKCQRCGICVNHCPAGAMRMEEGNPPHANKEICISCYCCQEMCPSDAIVLKGRLFNLIRRPKG